MSNRQKRRLSSLTPKSKIRLPLLAILWPPRTNQIHFQQLYLPNHFLLIYCSLLSRNKPLQVDLSKLANNSNLTSDKHKKHLKNNLCFYYSTEDYKLDSCLKKQTIVTPKVLQTQDLRVNEPYIRLTQENSMENFVQDSLSYILITYGPCSTTLAYHKWPCICLKVNIC